MLNLFSLSLGASPHPLAFKREPLSALGALGLASGAVSGIGNVIGSLFSNSSNKKIAREQMAWQTQERNASQQWQEKMWIAQNQYNSPSAVKARLQEAGYNPWLSGSEQVGQGASLPSAPSMPSAPNMPTQQPVNFGAPFAGMAAPLFNVAQLELQKQGVDADVSNKNAKTFEQVLKNAHDMRMQGESRDFIHKYVTENTPYALGTGDDHAFNMYMEQYREQQHHADMVEFENRLLLNYGEQERFRKLELIKQQINNVISQIDLNKSSSNLNAQRILTEIARAANLNADTATINALRDYVVAEAEYQADLMLYSRDDAKADYFGDTQYRQFKYTPEYQRARMEAGHSFDERTNKRTKQARVLSDILRGNSGYTPNASYSMDKSYSNSRSVSHSDSYYDNIVR